MSYPEPVDEMEIKPEKKLWAAYLFWFFLGGIGAHNLYLRNYQRAGVMFALNISANIAAVASQNSLFIALIAILLVIAFYIIWIIDAFKMPKRVEEFNRHYGILI